MKKLSGKTDDFMNTFDGWFTTTVDDDVCDEQKRRHWDVVYMLGWLRNVDTIIVQGNCKGSKDQIMTSRWLQKAVKSICMVCQYNLQNSKKQHSFELKTLEKMQNTFKFHAQNSLRLEVPYQQLTLCTSNEIRENIFAHPTDVTLRVTE